MNKAIDKAMVMERPCGTAEEMEAHLRGFWNPPFDDEAERVGVEMRVAR